MLDSFEATLGERIRYYRKRKGMTQKQTFVFYLKDDIPLND